ncbi:glycosyltransferase family 4 protein [Vibrio coralliirubri]|uniref:glycosyltransferase family 4 protein n=1 Tax=Vibrio coralliirubri TaxID=1516159 RepID=UPI002FD57095
MKNKKVLVLAEYIGENHNSTAYYWSKIVRQLSNNFDVILVTPDSSHSRSFSDKYKVETRFVELAKHNKNSLISRLIGQVKQTIYFSRALHRELDNTDLVFTGTNPIITVFMMALIKRASPFKWLVLVHDIFPNNLVPAGVTTKNSLLYRVLTYLSKKVYSAPERLICIGRDMKSLLGNKVDDSTKTTYVPNWASTETTKNEPKEKNLILTELGWDKDSVVFQFFGNMGRLQGISNLLESIELTTNDKARFLFIGCGSESSHVERVFKKINDKNGYERAHYYGRLDLEKNNHGLNACDVALVTLSNGMYGLGVPSKAYFSMAADKPIIYVGETGTELELLLGDYRVGWHCVPEKPSKLARLIDNISESYDSRVDHQLHPRAVLEKEFSEQIALGAITQQVKELLK